MDRWRGVLKVPLHLGSNCYYRVGVSLCLSSTSKCLSVPDANLIFFNGDRVVGTGNPVIERLSDLQIIADILVSKFGPSSNAWVIESSVFNGPFAVYRDFIPTVNGWGEPNSYDPSGFPGSSSSVSLLFNCLEEAKSAISRKGKEQFAHTDTRTSHHQPKTYILGFSKGGIALNQLVTELGFSEAKPDTNEQPSCPKFPEVEQETQILPGTREDFLNSIREIHYVDVGLNSAGAYITDQNVIELISKRFIQGGAPGIRFVLHGTPRQWCDRDRTLIRIEKDKLLHLLQSESQRTEGRLQVCEKFYFGDRLPDLQMHFEIIEAMDVN
ncbi:hypothetical protein K2173_024935 [Erythroxylum novogranatense]|uniref:DUF2235 domain-containing protein n=1 Tax=Erythroxylum novogranatense TaxID=1862640 RepID=A0AAV8UCJ4_9ROSI|nr:hypothetical protein K2173_024935 [Erythroxylum novogranatense]